MANILFSHHADNASAGFGSSRRRDAPDQAERDIVAGKRRLRASWQAVAAMIGRSVHDARTYHDPTYQKEGVATRSTPEAPSALSDADQVLVQYGLAKHATLKMLGVGPCTSNDIAEARDICSRVAQTALDRLRTEGLASRTGTIGGRCVYLYTLSPKGAQALAQFEARR
jgi:hypothetical protein